MIFLSSIVKEFEFYYDSEYACIVNNSIIVFLVKLLNLHSYFNEH